MPHPNPHIHAVCSCHVCTIPQTSTACTDAPVQELEQGGAAVSGGRRSLQASTMSGLYVEVFYNYPYGASSQPNPIPASMKPDYVTSAPNINFAEGTTATNGAIQVLAKATTQFAVRFSGAVSPNVAHTGSLVLCPMSSRVQVSGPDCQIEACGSICGSMVAVRERV